jgi:hypothetical protein
MISALTRAGRNVGLLQPEALAVTIKIPAARAPGGIMAPYGELQQTRHGLRF